MRRRARERTVSFPHTARAKLRNLSLQPGNLPTPRGNPFLGFVADTPSDAIHARRTTAAALPSEANLVRHQPGA